MKIGKIQLQSSINSHPKVKFIIFQNGVDVQKSGHMTSSDYTEEAPFCQLSIQVSKEYWDQPISYSIQTYSYFMTGSALT